MSLSRRVPSFFCCASKSSTCLVFSRPSSTSASAIRSPNVLTGGMCEFLSENLAQVFYQLDRRHDVPEQPILSRLGQFFGRGLIKGIGGRHENTLAHAIKGK